MHCLQGRELFGNQCQAPGNLGQPPRTGGGAGSIADVDRRGFDPGAGQGTEAKATVRGDPGLAVDWIVVRAGDTRQHMLDDTCRHGAAGRHIDL